MSNPFRKLTNSNIESRFTRFVVCFRYMIVVVARLSFLRNLFQFLSLNDNISLIDSHNILNSQSTHIILEVLKFIEAAGYPI